MLESWYDAPYELKKANPRDTGYDLMWWPEDPNTEVFCLSPGQFQLFDTGVRLLPLPWEQNQEVIGVSVNDPTHQPVRPLLMLDPAPNATYLGIDVQVRGRSGLATKGIQAHFGTIDEQYQKRIGVILFNHGHSELEVIPFKTRIAQLVIATFLPVELIKVGPSMISETRGGFGSTGL